MAHSGLKGRIFKVNNEKALHNIENALNTLKYNEDDPGVKRGKTILETKQISYETMESMCNFYRNYSKDTDYKEFLILGGESMKHWVFETLKTAKDQIETSAYAKNDVLGNQFKKEHNKDNVHTTETRNLKEEESIVTEPKKKAALCILFNSDKQVLLVQRADGDRWMPGKWAFVGGGVEKGEDPEAAVKRECGEEIGLIPSFVKEKFIKDDNNGTRCYMYLGLTKNSNVKLNSEHQNFKWVDLPEIKEMDCVPGVYDDVVDSMKSI
jgi:mutator protein MutT